MRLIFAAFTVLLLVSFADRAVDAEESEVRTTGGAFLGNWNFSQINSDDAVLDVEATSRVLLSVSAGYIANKSYREIWEFHDSTLIYTKLPSRTQFRGGVVSEKSSIGLICGDDNQDCDNPQAKNISRNLTIVTFRSPDNSEECAGLVYVGTEGSRKIFRGTFGNYLARSTACAPFESDSETAVALSAQYLSLVKKDGRPIADLARYD
ncbi:MAG: hypothetical protein HKN28_02450, partial [Alphaproteobacteria bacterium]|nr:hypothetical protein [Alphaproteobacteria bacterium]